MIVILFKKKFIFNVNLNFIIDLIEINIGKYKIKFIKQKLKGRK